VLRFNPSPFAREGVPGLGYAVVSEPRDSRREPVAIEPLDGGVSVDGIELGFLDEPDVGDLYNFCPATEDQRPSPPTSVTVDGDVVTAAWDALEVEVRITRRDGERFVRLDGTIRNRREDHRLRLHVGLGAEVDHALAGAPFELVSRPLVGEGSEGEAPSPTWPARHVVLAGDTAVIHEGVFEYEIADGREIAVTLLRCVGTISREHLATRPWPAGPQTPTPGAQMLGETAFSLAVLPRADRDELLREWERFAMPLLEVAALGGGTRPSTGTLLDVIGDGVELSNVRRHDGDVEARVWNPRSDEPRTVSIDGHQARVGPAAIETIALD
jgi:mannosylglycerate hydrolase